MKILQQNNHPNLDGSSHAATNLVHLAGGCEQLDHLLGGPG